ncbi:acyl carrier protein [Paracoccus aeridis]|uniref:acyl carrier protein n=1 Tax=Paracoccus aeridis TaxID=1966466 RepID=UPI0010AA794E|nr:phosphopantetheine-binding protein [Paracoccus aeridis]
MTFDRLLRKYAKAAEVRDSDPLFAEGLDFSSIGFTEFVMAIEDETGLDIDPDELDHSIRTVGQLYDHLSRM